MDVRSTRLSIRFLNQLRRERRTSRAAAVQRMYNLPRVQTNAGLIRRKRVRLDNEGNGEIAGATMKGWNSGFGESMARRVEFYWYFVDNRGTWL